MATDRETLEAARKLHGDLCAWIGDESELKPIATALTPTPGGSDGS